jgi:hypothetical protein
MDCPSASLGVLQFLILVGVQVQVQVQEEKRRCPAWRTGKTIGLHAKGLC